MEKCYYKKLSETNSKEGFAYLKGLGLEIKICRFYCSGFYGYGECDKFITESEAKRKGLGLEVKI